MSLSSVRSETALRNRLFSSSRSIRRFTCSVFSPPGATDNTSPRSPRSGGLRPPCSGPARPEHRPAATSRRSLQACIASLSLQSSLMSKTYLKSDHFNGGGSIALRGGSSMPRNNYLARIATAACFAMMALLMPSQGQAQTDQRVQKSMELLKSMTAKLGAPKIEGTEQVGGKDAPALYFGSTKLNNNFEIVDAIGRE